MRIAFVHEYLIQFGGAERVLAVLSDMFPRAPIYTLMYDQAATRGRFADRQIITSFLQNAPFSRTHHHWYPLLMPLAIEQFDFSEFDVVISLSASFAKGIITKPGTKHICYCLTPPRFLWDNSQQFVEDFGFPRALRGAIGPFLTYTRIWDRQAADRPDQFWAISDFVRARIEKYYHKDAMRIYPPVDVSRFQISKDHHDYFLMVGRLVSYKKFDIAIRAFTELGLPLTIVGAGPEARHLQRIAGPRIRFCGMVPDDNLAELYAHARAVVFPQEEDFGIVPLEAMASGRPVIAYRGGGATETVIEGVTGMFFNEQTPESLAEAVRHFHDGAFQSDACRIRAEEFDVNVFQKHILSHL